MPTFLHVGCGRKRKDQTTRGFNTPEWQEVRLAIDPAVAPDIVGTMTDTAAVASESVDAIFSSHNLEHLEAHEVPVALQEFRRVLKPTGFAVITCPDLQSVCALGAADKLLEPCYTAPAGPIAPIDILCGFRPALARGNRFMAHRCGFTQTVLTGTLIAAGFAQVVTLRRGYGPYFDLWALATKGPMEESALRHLATQHFCAIMSAVATTGRRPTSTAAEMSWEDIKTFVAELAIQSKETDRKLQETDRKFQETDRRFQETEAQMRETDRKMREVFERFDNLSRRFGDLGNRLGVFVEAMVEPALVELLSARGLDVSEVHRRVTSRRGGKAIEIDLLVVDGDTAVAVECKSRLTQEEVQRHVERMNRIKRLLPKYADMRIQGAAAGMVVDDEAAEAAQAAGLWVLAQSGETVRLLNDKAFQPRVW